MKAYLTGILLILTTLTGFAQKFWLTTYEFPGREKTGITLTPNGCMLVSLTNGVIKSCDEGNRFSTVLNSSAVYSIYSNNLGEVFVGGTGKIFRSFDNGQTWDSVSVGTTYPINKIIQNSQGHLFAITGILTNDDGFIGDGVFFSNNKGLTWSQRNNGLGIYTCIEQIAIDKNDRIYVATADEYVTGNGGLFISENSGNLWEHINISVDGRGAINDQIKVANAWNISVSPQDSVYFSFFGTAVNTSVRLNTVKHISEVRNNTHWKVYAVNNSPTWWQDKLLNPVHFARNGDKYSSVSGSIGFGGTFFCKNNQTTWQKINFGLGIDINGFQNIQHFAETPSGKIFMVQTLDERVYYTDTSVVTSLPNDNHELQQINIFPNPVHSGDNVFFSNFSENQKVRIKCYDASGKQVFETTDFLNSKITAPQQQGIYFLNFEMGKYKSVKKLIVY
ncbi:T9SS type A sorting domain-containing protein [Thermoflexibacter ruber]|uniref:Por secretion system C-terminal sorting domain-containing protein n=1 Tax=Thermoflexibacter ruber TaxID=1003 RepID=A0A1I2C9U3_9BACT|nr:T9SS type A sorting domain-containing protein [Thermoflexibacter ruber]SFE65109.1 Por secretion system C-terminal sorting domain-containing protein [Thermoflexibacter ruber]